jgi:glucose-6-phosphate isomerase
MWYFAGNGRGEKDMVVLPYKDRLALFSKYLQQLVMESLGKERDLDGNVVNPGIAVYGNKGSTDQHAYVQQLRDGVNNFFATFIEVRKGTRWCEHRSRARCCERRFPPGFPPRDAHRAL